MTKIVDLKEVFGDIKADTHLFFYKQDMDVNDIVIAQDDGKEVWLKVNSIIKHPCFKGEWKQYLLVPYINAN